MKELVSCLSSCTSCLVESFLFEKWAPQVTDHFERDNGFAVILRLLLYKMEPEELSLIFFSLFAISTCLSPTKEKRN